MTNNLKKCQKFAIGNFSGPVTPRLSYPSWKIVRNIIGITACPRTSTRYLLKAQLSDPPVHVIWPVLRVHRQRVAIMFAISTCIYVRRSNDRHVRSDSQLRRTRHRTMLHRYIWIVDTRPIRSLRSFDRACISASKLGDLLLFSLCAVYLWPACSTWYMCIEIWFLCLKTFIG